MSPCTIARAPRSETFDWGEITWFANDQIGNSTDLTLGRCIIRPGKTNPLHHHPNTSEVLTVVGPTPDPSPGNPNAVQEWCINSAVVDPFTKSVLVNNEDGKLYRWSFVTNTLTETVTLTSGLGEAYTPTLVGPDGVVYAINNAILFAVGN